MDAIGKRLDFRIGKSGIGDSITQIKLDSFPSVPSVDSLKTWIKYSNPDLQALDLETTSLDRQLVLEKSLKRQSFSLTLGFDRESDGTNLIGGGVVLPLPFFNRNQAGIEQFLIYRKLEPESHLQFIASAWTGVGHARAGDYDASCAEFRRSLDLVPLYAPATMLLAGVMAETGRHEEAAKLFEMMKISKELSMEIRALKRSMARTRSATFAAPAPMRFRPGAWAIAPRAS